MKENTVRRDNGRVMDLMSLFLNVGSDLITEDMIDEVRRAGNFDTVRAYAELLGALCDLDTCGKDRLFFRNYFLPMVHELSPKPFREDPFYERIREIRAEDGPWKMQRMELKPYEAFVAGDLRVFPDGRMIPPIGFFRESYSYPAVLENGREWMTLLPNETMTTEPALRQAFGRVLTYGLGLGYFAVRAAAKPEVVSVTVVERSEEVIRLFSAVILPLFPEVKEKIQIVNEDAFRFASTITENAYDFVFADIWHDAGDGPALYHRFQTYESRCPGAVYRYWLEDTMKCYDNPALWPEKETKE